MTNQELLNSYKKYDIKSSLIKIFVSYIKPSFLFKSDILTPIHLGKAISKNDTKAEDLEWLCTNCIGDDDFDGNISYTNRRVGFLTGTYQAWKNYEKLGNPDYFGSFGYRRLLNPSFLEKFEEYDLILPHKKDFRIETIKEQFLNYHGEELYKNTINAFEKIYPDELNNLEKYFNGTAGYFDELYVMKKEIFFGFCNWIFPLLFEYLKQPQIILKNNDLRDIGFIMERLTGYYCNELSKKYKFLEVEMITSEKLVVNKGKLNKEFLANLRKGLECKH